MEAFRAHVRYWHIADILCTAHVCFRPKADITDYKVRPLKFNPRCRPARIRCRTSAYSTFDRLSYVLVQSAPNRVKEKHQTRDESPLVRYLERTNRNVHDWYAS